MKNSKPIICTAWDVLKDQFIPALCMWIFIFVAVGVLKIIVAVFGAGIEIDEIGTIISPTTLLVPVAATLIMLIVTSALRPILKNATNPNSKKGVNYLRRL